MRKVLLPLVVLPAVLLSGCGHSHHFATNTTSNAAQVAITVAPATAQLIAGQTQQFTATVTNASNRAVRWRVTGGGTISASGMYTAPTPVPGNATAIVTATSVEDSSKSDTGAVTLVPVSVHITPENPSVALIATQQFAAVVTGTTNTAVTWSVSNPAVRQSSSKRSGARNVSEPSCSEATCGTISTAGLYRAPWCLPTPAGLTVTATSIADPTKSFSTTVTNVMAGPQLSGHYNFLFQGTDPDGMTQSAGTFVADGGQITNGLEDVVRMSGAHTSINFSGTYASSCYARGTMTIEDSLGGTYAFAYALNSAADRAHYIELDNTGERGAGQLAKLQVPASQIDQGSGNFAFGFAGSQDLPPVFSPAKHEVEPAGVGTSFERVGLIGQFHLDGEGTITTGLIDANYGGTTLANSALSGTYTYSSTTGRGTASFVADVPLSQTYSLSFYPVSADEAFWISIDSPAPVSPESHLPSILVPMFKGVSMRQSGSLDLASLNTTSVFYLTGVAQGTEDSDVAVGIVIPDGSGNISGGPMDENDDATTSNYPSVVGTYTVGGGGEGRGTAHLDAGEGVTRDMTFYLVSPNTAFLLEGTGSVAGPSAGVGFLEPRSGTPFSPATFTGLYSVGTSELATWYVPVMSGMAFADGVSTVLGMGDQSDIFGNYPAVNLFSSSYEMPESGRTTFGPLIFYMISPDKGVVFEASDTQHQPSVIMIER